MVHTSGKGLPCPIPQTLPSARFILGIVNVKEKFKLLCCPVMPMNGVSFPSNGMSQEKREFLTLGAVTDGSCPSELFSPIMGHIQPILVLKVTQIQSLSLFL